MLYHRDQFRSGPTKDVEGGTSQKRDADKWREAIENNILNEFYEKEGMEEGIYEPCAK